VHFKGPEACAGLQLLAFDICHVSLSVGIVVALRKYLTNQQKGAMNPVTLFFVYTISSAQQIVNNNFREFFVILGAKITAKTIRFLR